MGSVDYKLLWRDPYPTWASSHGRVIQIGDAAHAFLPTSASGATIAMEDAFSLAASLQLGGKRNLALAIKVHNKLRFQRITCAQKMGFKNRQQYHETTFKPAEEGARPTFPMVGLWSDYNDTRVKQYASKLAARYSAGATLLG